METMNFGDLNNENNNENSSQAAPKAPRNKKLIWSGVILAVLILAVIGWQYWQYTNSPYYQQLKATRALEKLYTDDNIGGKTPEETLALYTDAIKIGDTELALTYVGAYKDDVKKQLMEYKNLGKLSEYANYLAMAKRSTDKNLTGNSNDILFEVLDGNRTRLFSVFIYKTKNDVWKIREL